VPTGNGDRVTAYRKNVKGVIVAPALFMGVKQSRREPMRLQVASMLRSSALCGGS
jgi:hypothetical protein